MDWNRFWAILDTAARTRGLDQLEALTSELDRLRWFEVLEFQARFEEAVAAADRPGLRTAAERIQGLDSDRSFRDFRIWLVGRGRAVFDSALRDPDSLADSLDGDPVDSLGLEGAAIRVYEAKTGMSDFYQRLQRVEAMEYPAPPVAATAFPRLLELYPDSAE